MIALRSLLFNLVLWVSVVIYAPLTLFTFPFPPLMRYRFIIQWTRFNLWALERICHLRYEVEGLEHLPADTAIVFSKHESSWETLALQIILPPQVWVLKRELLWIPLFGWGLALTDPIAIDRRSGRRAIEQIIRHGRERLESGRWVVVFPEGTRTAPGQLRRFGYGGAVLAEHTGHPVVPIAHDAGSYWPRRGFHKQPGVIRVVIGAPLPTQGKTAAEINALAEQWMTQAVAELSARRAQQQGSKATP